MKLRKSDMIYLFFSIGSLYPAREIINSQSVKKIRPENYKKKKKIQIISTGTQRKQTNMKKTDDGQKVT